MGRIVPSVQLPLLRPGLRLLALTACAAALVAPGRAAAAEGLPHVQAHAFLVAGGPSAEVLAADDADARVPIASITKLMTALVVLDHAKPGDTVTVAAPAAVVGESSINLHAGEQLTVRDLLAGALIQSANDAAYALAEHVGRGSVERFVRMMNAKAAELGLTETHFARPDGLDTPGHLSSAHDVLILARTAMQRPLIRSLVRERSARIAGGRSLSTWNDLLGRYPGLYGVKTGHTDDAGWCEIAVARRDGTTVYAVILGSPTRDRRNADLASLLNWGFHRFARLQVVEGGKRYASAEIPFSDDSLPLVAEKGVAATVLATRPLVETVVAPMVVDLPVRKGQRLGEVRVTEAGRLVAKVPLVASRDVDEAGFGTKSEWYAGQAVDEAGAMLGSVFG